MWISHSASSLLYLSFPFPRAQPPPSSTLLSTLSNLSHIYSPLRPLHLSPTDDWPLLPRATSASVLDVARSVGSFLPKRCVLGTVGSSPYPHCRDSFAWTLSTRHAPRVVGSLVSGTTCSQCYGRSRPSPILLLSRQLLSSPPVGFCATDASPATPL